MFCGISEFASKGIASDNDQSNCIICFQRIHARIKLDNDKSNQSTCKPFTRHKQFHQITSQRKPQHTTRAGSKHKKSRREKIKKMKRHSGTLRRPSFWICVRAFLLIQLSRVCWLENFPFSLHYLFRVIRCSKERSITRRRSKAHNAADVVVDMSVVRVVCSSFCCGLYRIGLPHETLLK